MSGPGGGRFAKTRGCHYYNSRGISKLSLGPCPFGDECRFVHPNDREWSLLEWSDNVGRLKGTARSRSRSRSRDRVRSRSRGERRSRSRERRRSRSRGGRPRVMSRDRCSGWDRKRVGRENEKDRDLGRARRARSRDRSRDRVRRRRSRSPPSPRSTRSRRRRLSPPGRRSSYHSERDRSPRRPSMSPSRLRRDSFASAARATLSPSASTYRPRHQDSFMSDIILPQSPEEQKPDFRELERARLLERAKQANVEQVSRETIDLRETRTPTATSPPPPDLSASLPTMSTPLPPPPSETPPPPPIESPVFPPPAMPIIDSPTTVYPPPPLPEAPDFDDILQDNQLLDGTWSTRVHLLTEIIQLSSEMQTIQDDFQAVQKLAEASTMLPEEAQARLGGRLGQAETLLHAKKAEYDRLREEIVSNASGVWPIAKEQMERDVMLLTEYQEMVGYLAGLKRVTSELQEALAVLDIGRMPAIPALTQALREDVEARVQEEAVMPTRQKGGADEGAMDIDGAPPPYQPPAGSTPVLPPSERTIFQRDFDEISSRLDGIEKDLYAIDDAVWQRENELRDEFMAELEGKKLEWYTLMSRGSKIGESGMKRGGEEGGEVEEERVEEEEEEGGDLEEGEGIAALKRELCEMRTQTIEGAKEVDEMTEILENFQMRLVSAEGLLPEANLEYQAALQRNADLHSRLAVLEAADRTSTAKLDATHNMVSIQPPSPPSSPAPLPSADILHALRDPLKAELRRAVIPIIEDSRAQMTKEIDEKVSVLYGTVFERAEPSVRVLKALERVLTQGGIPVNGFIGASGKEGGAMNGAASH